MMGENRRQHVAGRAADINNGLEDRKIVSGGNGRRLLVMKADHRLTEQ
jgi:hypothetical protein